MRKPSFLICVLLLANALLANAQEYYGHYAGKKVPFKLSTSQIVVKYKNSESLMQAAKSTSPLPKGIKNTVHKSALPGVAFLDLEAGLQPADVARAVSMLSVDGNVLTSSPVLIAPNGKAFGALTDEVIVTLSPGTSEGQMRQFINIGLTQKPGLAAVIRVAYTHPKTLV